MLINKNNLPLVAVDFMNEVHLEDVEIINELYDFILQYEKNQNLENQNLISQTYEKWLKHTVDHFAGEEKEMILKNFPAYFVHKAEHDMTLETMSYVLENWKKKKNFKILKEYIENDMLNWLINHIETMDTITAMFFETGFSPCNAH